MTLNSIKRNGQGVSRIFKATTCSFQGFAAAWKSEDAFRQELVLSVILFPVSFLIAESFVHWSILFFSLVFLITAEIINTAVETLADRITLDDDPMVKIAKDLGSSAVFMALIFLGVTWTSSIFLRFVEV